MMLLIISFTILVFHLRYIACAYGDPVGCWPDNVIPFRILPGFKESQTYVIYDVIGDFHRSTCLRWVDGDKVPYNATEHVVFQWVEQNYTCRTHQKLRGGKVVVELSDSCFMKRVLTHLMMHVLGFAHEHQRADRNCYVFVDYRELRRDKVSLLAEEFDIIHIPWLERFPYDKHSNTHHPRSVVLKVQLEKNYRNEPPKYSEEPLGNESGNLTPLDRWKILYKFCGFPHFCDFFPQICVFMDEVELTCAKHQDSADY